MPLFADDQPVEAQLRKAAVARRDAGGDTVVIALATASRIWAS